MTKREIIVFAIPAGVTTYAACVGEFVLFVLGVFVTAFVMVALFAKDSTSK